MKRQLNAPSFIAPKKPEGVLRGLPWLRLMSEETVCYIIEQAEMISYEFGDVMLRQGEPTDAIYLIVSGMVKVRCIYIRNYLKNTSHVYFILSR